MNGCWNVQVPADKCKLRSREPSFQRTSLLLAYIEILQHFSLKMLHCTSNLWPVFCFALSSALTCLLLFTGAYATPTSFIRTIHHTLSWTFVQKLVEAGDYGLYSFKYRYFSNTNASIRFRRPLLMPPEPYGVFFMMDGCSLFCFKTSIHCHYKAWKSQDIFIILL